MFRPELRETIDAIHSEAREIIQSEYFSTLLEDINEVLMIVNRHRQIIYVNKDLFDELNIPGSEDYIGLRPGECLGCVNMDKTEHGCGSTEFCTVCGLAQAIIDSETSDRGERECNILLKGGGALNLEITTRRFHLNNNSYIFCTVKDISEKKQRQNFEEVFLHDLMNRAASIHSIIQAMGDESADEAVKLISLQNEYLIDEIQSHRILIKAENQELRLKKQDCDTDRLVQEIIQGLQAMSRFSSKTITADLCGAHIQTDSILLRRIILNLLKNALEASADDEPVHVKTQLDTGKNHFILTVSNNSQIPRDNQLRMFQKTFSTKGEGRGYGTYSVKLLTESYLGGEVSFSSGTSEGTTFTVALPVE